jgi:mono/diheme cytochrome c family protein/glucose/arabinose dehydrogenase
MIKQGNCVGMLCAGLALFIFSCTGNLKKETENPSPPETPEEELATIHLDSGLQIQLVASEPMIEDPVVLTFDEDGRLWVVEMRGFMPDIDGNGENKKVGRVSILEDTNGDGLMDKSTIYIDSLIMPRALAVIKGGALVAENEALWLTQDLDGDLRADTKTLIDPKYAGGPLIEHAGNALWRSMDNWYYNAKSKSRYKIVNGTWIRDSTEFRGQWGMSHDDVGRLYYNYNWSQLHADLVPPNYLSRNKNHVPTTGIDHGLTIDRRVYPIRPNPAVNRGYIPGTLDEEGHLREFTAACAPLYYRGTALPQSYYGNAFVCEPSGNLIKRNIVSEDKLILSAHDAHPGREFVASTDERFRPVHLAQGSDGALYVADMYRGLVQHGKYVTPYLRDQTLRRNLDKPVNRGRIWRIVPRNWKPAAPKKLSKASTEELIAELSSNDGWHRDMAQRLLVERNDKGTGKLLSDLIASRSNPLARFHALWALEGIKQVTPELLFPLLSDPDNLVSNTSLRLIEPFAHTDKKLRVKLGGVLLTNFDQAPLERILQMALSSTVLETETSHQLLAKIIERYGSSALIRDAVMSSLQNQELAFLQALWKSSAWKTRQPDREIFLEMLTTAIVKKRDPSEINTLLTFADVPKDSFGWQEKAVLTSLSIQGNNSKQKPIRLAATPRFAKTSDGKLDPSRIQSLNALFEWPGHKVVRDTAQQKNALNQEQQQLFILGRQHYLTTCSGCHGTDGAGIARFAPPLIGSDWVTGNEKRLALILLHGIEGPLDVAGKRYDAPDILPVMPAHSTMEDASITAILMYIRNEWGNHAGPVNKRTVGTTRHTTQGRVIPWTAEELNRHMKEKPPAPQK